MDTHYARSGDAHIAYQIMGSGPVDLLMTSHINISIDSFDREPHLASFLERAATFARIILFDQRGIGLSDPISPESPPTLEQMVDDAVAVLDAAASTRAAAFGTLYSGPPMILLAATHPDRISALITCSTYARLLDAPDYPIGMPSENLDAMLDTTTAPDRDFATFHAPSLAADDRFKEWWIREGKRGASPATARGLMNVRFTADVRGALSSIRSPTIVFHRPRSPWGGHRDAYLAQHISQAKLVELAGSDNFPYAEDVETLVGEIEELLTGSRHHHEPDRVLANVLFTDIVSSTEGAAKLGDRAWKQLLTRHDEMVRRQIARFGGREIKLTGDGVLATFDGTGRSVRAAVAIREGAGQLGIEVRAGVHAGEIELMGKDITGIAVVIARRVCDLAGSGQVLVSSTVPALVAGSGLEFDDCGEHDLKGVPGRWHLYAVKS